MWICPGDDWRPADVLIPHWTGGLDTALDVTVINSLQDATAERKAQEAGFAIAFAHQRKMGGAAEDCQQQGLAFVPLVAESLGCLVTLKKQDMKF